MWAAFSNLWVWHLEDVAASNLSSVHQLVDLVQILQVDRLEGSMDETTLEEVKSLSRVLSVADV